MRTISFLFLVCMFSIADMQRCCGNPKNCPAQASCLCEDDVDSCIYEVKE